MTTPTPQLPIVLGVSGHRDIPAGDEAILQESVKSIFADYRKRYPDTPLIMLTGLAEGADQLVARVALEFGVEIGAVLPLQVSEYERDFVDPLTRQNFHDLLAKSHWQVVVQPETVTAPREETQRNSCYAAVGHYICRHAQMLIALWDGDEKTVKMGGTAYVVLKFRRGLLDAEGNQDGLLDFPDCGPVMHVWTRRFFGEDRVPPDKATGLKEELLALPLGLEVINDNYAEFEKDRWNTIFQSIDSFNRNARNVTTEKIQEKLNGRQGKPLETGLLGRQLLLDDLTPEQQRIATTYAIADELSYLAQMKRSRIFQQMVLLFMAAVLFELLYSGPFSFWPLLVAAILCGVATYQRHGQALKEQVESCYLDYRALAEGLRVQYYWKRAGINRCVAEDFLREQRDSLEWIRQSLLNLTLPRTTEKSRPENSLNIDLKELNEVRELWVNGQIEYFLLPKDKSNGKYLRDKKEGEKLDSIIKKFLMAGVATMLFAVVWHAVLPDARGAVEEYVLQGLIVVYGLLFWLLPTTELYRRIMSYDESSRNYLSAGLIFQACNARLETVLNDKELTQEEHIKKARILLLQLGQKALKENNAWLVSNRDRPLQPPL